MSYSSFGIEIPIGKTRGEVATTCPQCSHLRKPEHQKTKCLGINLDIQVWHCSHCNWKGGLPKEQPIQQNVTKTYSKPVFKNVTALSDGLVKWFESERKISQGTLIKLQITEGEEWLPQINGKRNCIHFNYFRNKELVNIKYRDAKKNFKLYKDAELIFYNLDSLIGATECYITEGENDVLALVEAGIMRAGTGVLSVPNGANKNTNNLAYVDNCIDSFINIETIYLALDSDTNGRKLREDLANRFGKDKCKFIEWKDQKDANDVLKQYGIQGVIECCSEKKEFPLEGLFTVSSFGNEIDDMYVNGLDRGVKVGMGKFDTLLRFVRGYITVITGVPNHGKSDFLDQIILKLMTNHDWKVGFYSPENKPTKLHFSKLARKLIGKNWFGGDRITEDEKNLCKAYLEDKVYFIKPEKDFTLDSILNSVKVLKKRKGIDCFVLDAWNRLEHKHGGQNETKYINESLIKLDAFCELYNVHCFLVAHPTKVEKDRNTGLHVVPNLYSISGSAHFYNIVANGITVYRDFSSNTTKAYVQKVKFSHWGEQGVAEFKYDLESGRYNEFNGGAMDTSDKAAWVGYTKTEPREEQTTDKGIIINTEEPPF